ncbi:MAG: AraC family transcriptional regulator ligand-binding domain-containing protein [Colwellia sp.]
MRKNNVVYKVRSSALTDFSKFCHDLSINPIELLSNQGLPTAILRSSDLLFPYASFAKILNQGAKYSNEPLFGLKLSLHQGAGIIGPLGLLAAQCETFSESLAMIQKYVHFHAQGLQFNLETSQSTSKFSLSWPTSVARKDDLIQLAELSIGLSTLIFKDLAPEGLMGIKVQLKHPAQSQISSYASLLGCPVEFEQEEYTIEFPTRFLLKKPKAASEETKEYLETFLEKEGKCSQTSIKQQVIQLIRKLTPTGEATVDHVAGLLGLSARTLQYELNQINVEFRQLRNQVRLELAKEELSQTQISIIDLALLLGYAETSAFSRAFKKWTGYSPLQWRKQEIIAQNT